jgi:hypothetical protein
MIHHYNCPRYSERELIQRPGQRHRPNGRFIAYLQSRWVLECRFGSNKSRIDTDLYVLRVLHCLRGAPSMNPFVGVVFDEGGGIINAYLCELLATGKICNVIVNAKRSGAPISWERRERWCRQIVQGVAEMNLKSFVVGFLAATPDCAVAVDADDNAVLYNLFRTTFEYESTRGGVLSPEYRQSALVEGYIAATPSTDMYQLGLLIWRISKNTFTSFRSQFCKFAGCTTKAETVCCEPHADLVQLPAPGEDTPQYLKEIITACRRENPDERPAAWELL